MPVDWLITTPNYPSGVAPADLGITVASRNLRSRAASEVNLSIVLKSIYDDPPFAFGDQVSIIRNGLVWFAGNVSSTPKISATGNSVSMGATISDAWWWLGRQTYLQQWPSGRSTRTILGGSPTGSSFDYTDPAICQTTSSQLTSLLTFAALQSELEPRHGMFSVGKVSMGSLPMFVEPLNTATMTEALESCLRWHLNCVTWFDYTHVDESTPSPALNLADYGVDAGLGLFNMALPGNPVSFSIQSRPDLVLPGVLLFYEQTGEGEDGSTYTGLGASYYVSTDSAGGTGDTLLQHEGTLVATMQVGNGVSWALDGNVYASNNISQTPVPNELANALFLSHQKLHYDGSLTFVSQDPGSMGNLMGNMLNLTGGRTEWASMEAIIQSVSEDMRTGHTTINFGSPRHAQVMNFRSIASAYTRGAQGGKPTAQSARDSTPAPSTGWNGTIDAGSNLKVKNGLVLGISASP